ncbi:MAG: immunoglobulin domain-containing protein [Tannerella sp.]|jgi:hypothetical protein|nr:immunoglobulin domain-containing protein [Tannerella sp.]
MITDRRSVYTEDLVHYYYYEVLDYASEEQIEEGYPTITVNPIVNAAAPVITLQPQNVSVYTDDNVMLSVTANVSDGGTLSYQWYRNTTNSNGGGTGISGATGNSYSSPDLVGRYRLVLRRCHEHEHRRQRCANSHDR